MIVQVFARLNSYEDGLNVKIYFNEDFMVLNAPLIFSYTISVLDNIVKFKIVCYNLKKTNINKC